MQGTDNEVAELLVLGHEQMTDTSVATGRRIQGDTQGGGVMPVHDGSKMRTVSEGCTHDTDLSARKSSCLTTGKVLKDDGGVVDVITRQG
jgi:hypothetical protein